MAIVKDWILATAEEIGSEVVHDHLIDGIETMRRIIVKHCPMKPDTAYMPVPRCDDCAHWDQAGAAGIPRHGACRLLVHGNYARDLAISRLAAAHSDEDNHPDFITSDRFGCVQWQAKRP